MIKLAIILYVYSCELIWREKMAVAWLEQWHVAYDVGLL